MAFSTQQVSKMCGVSLRQLQWWDESGLLRPTREDRNRSYTRYEVLTVYAIAELKRHGITVAKARRILPQFRRRLNSIWGGLDRFIGYVVTDGKRLCIEPDPVVAAEWAVRNIEPVAVIKLSAEMLQVKENAADRKQ